MLPQERGEFRYFKGILPEASVISNPGSRYTSVQLTCVTQYTVFHQYKLPTRMS